MGAFISFIVLVFRPNLSDNACNEILSLIPNGIVNGCECEVGINGLIGFGLDVEASCPLEFAFDDDFFFSGPGPDDDDFLGGTSCDIMISGGGNALGVALNDGSGDLSVGTNCDFAFGEYIFSAEGEFSTESVEIESCSISGTVDDGSGSSLPFDCSCENIGCFADPAFLFGGMRSIGGNRNLGDKGFVGSFPEEPFVADSSFLNAAVSCTVDGTMSNEVPVCVNLALLSAALNPILDNALNNGGR